MAKVRLLHSESMTRPIGAAWLSDSRILVVRNTGAVEVLEDYDGAVGKLVATVIRPSLVAQTTDGVAVLHEDRVSSFFFKSGVTEIANEASPIVASEIVVLDGRDEALQALATRDGDLWTREGPGAWVKVAAARLAESSCACVLSSGEIVLGSRTGELAVLSRTGQMRVRPTRVHADSIQQIVALPDGLVASVARDRALRVWRVDGDLSLSWSLPGVHEHFINSAAVVGRELWSGASDGTLARISLDSRTRLSIIKTHSDAIRNVLPSPDRSRVMTVCDDGSIGIMDHEASVLRVHGTPRQYVRCADYSPTGRIAVGTTGGAIRIGLPQDDSHEFFEVSEDSIRALAFGSPENLLSGDDGGCLWFTDLSDHSTRLIKRFSAGVTTVHWTGEAYCLVGSRDGMVRRISLEGTDESEAGALVHHSIVGDIMLDGMVGVLSCSDDHTIHALASDTLGTLKTWTLDNTAVNNLLRSGDAVIASTDGANVFVLDAATLTIIRVFEGHDHPVRALASIGPHMVASGDRSGLVSVWDRRTARVAYSHKFEDRVIRLHCRASDQLLQVVTEGEIAEVLFELDSVGEEWLSPSQEASPASGGALSGSEDLGVPQEEATRVAVNAFVPDVELVKSEPGLVLEAAEDALVRNFVRSREGVRALVELVGGGLSSARVFRLQVFGESGSLRVRAIGKLGNRAAIEVESSGYDGEVSRLGPEASPRHLVTSYGERGDFAGVFYSLSPEFDRSIFEVAREDEGEAARSIERLRELTLPWREGAPERKVRAGEVRRTLLPDRTLESLSSKFELNWTEQVDAVQLQGKFGTIHGDLHGENILINRHGAAMIIDYGDIKNSLSTIDPVTLELSFFFHVAGTLRGSDWPRPEQARQWRTANYLDGCPIPSIVRACWGWQDAAGAGQREVAVAAYSYLLRQLKYSDTSKDRALSLLRGARQLLSAT
jgi:WD40 repeat protein